MLLGGETAQCLRPASIPGAYAATPASSPQTQTNALEWNERVGEGGRQKHRERETKMSSQKVTEQEGNQIHVAKKGGMIELKP